MSDTTELELALAQAGNGSAPPWLRVLAAEVQRLRVECDDAERRSRSAQAHAAEWRERKEELGRHLAAARHALHPFYAYACLEDDLSSGHSAPDEIVVVETTRGNVHTAVTVGDFRRARRAWSGELT